MAANPAGNSAGPMLAQKVGGDVLYALVAGVTIATILAVLAGMAIAVSGAVAHDLYTNVIKKGHVDERGQLISGRLAGAVAACIAILLALGAKDLNIANVANIAFAIAASTTMPTLLLTIYWRRFNQVGALSAMIGGLIVSLGLVLLGPDVMGKDDAIWPLAIPAIVSVPASFLFAYVGTLIGAGRVGSTGMPYDEFEARAFLRRAPRRSASAAGSGSRPAWYERRAGPRRRGALGVPGGRRGRSRPGARALPARPRRRAPPRAQRRPQPAAAAGGAARPRGRARPGLVPAGPALEAEHARALADKEGLELAQGLLLARVLAAPAAGAHLV